MPSDTVAYCGSLRLAYRCEGSAGFALYERTGFPFHPVGESLWDTCSRNQEYMLASDGVSNMEQGSCREK